MDGFRTMTCDQCGRVWEALCYESSERLECPDCGYMVQVKPGNTKIPEDCRVKGSSDPCVICGGRMVQYGEYTECVKCGHKDLLL